MIGGVEWRLVGETGQIAAQLSDPKRDLTIAWDGGDRNLYLSVIAPAVANVPGSAPRVYAAPLPLLAALLLVPRELHEQLLELVRAGRDEAEGLVMAAAQRVVAKAPEPWPAVGMAAEAVEGLPRLAQQLERLALDLATEPAFTDSVAV